MRARWRRPSAARPAPPEGAPAPPALYSGAMEERRPKDKDEDDASRQTRSLAALALLLALVVLAIFIIQRLRLEGEIEDCLMAGRSDCDRLIERR